MVENLDVVIIGAGLSGIGAAYHLQTNCPNKSYVILEGRDSIGGTWDLFRYPGIRSDSDMYTLGYVFKPWLGEKAITDGPSILAYVKTTAKENGIEEKIRFECMVTRAEWDADSKRWRIEARQKDGRHKIFSAQFMLGCTGYYDYDSGYNPTFPGSETFKGSIIHPQFWPEDLNYAGKKVVVIGSGATAVTLVPEMAKTAHVTMLQRSPTYILSAPAVDTLARFLHKVLPDSWAYALNRWRNIAVGYAFYGMSRMFPWATKQLLLLGVRLQVGRDFDMRHFTPSYNPWDQRLCLVPDGDFFKSVRGGNARVVTDHVERFTESGILLKSGNSLDADIIVTATGLQVKAIGGVRLVVGGREVEYKDHFVYKGVMVSDIPNFGLCMGYVNASWTLKCDLAAQYFCRLMNYMEEHEYSVTTPRPQNRSMGSLPLLSLNSGYLSRALDRMPRQGADKPWRYNSSYFQDIWLLKAEHLVDDHIEFS